MQNCVHKSVHRVQTSGSSLDTLTGKGSAVHAGTVAQVAMTDEGSATMQRQRSRRRRAVFALVMSLGVMMLAGCSVGPIGAQPAEFHYSIHRDCSWGTGQAAVCQFTITNEASSNMTFEWTGASSPAGATFSPASGSVAIGATSDTITATDPFLCPITFQFVDSSHNVKAESLFNSPCQ